MSKWRSKEEKKRIKERVMKMRDKDKLIFRIIAERLGMKEGLARAAYYDWK